MLFTNSFLVYAQQTRKVLFLGNSYTYANNLPQIISEIALNAGDELIYDSNLIGGYTLQNHFASAVSKNKILADNWDYIILQEQSQTPTFIVPSEFMDGFGNLKTFIHQNKPCSLISAFMTWGRENGDVQNCPNNPGVCTYLSMQDLLEDRYMDMSDLFESEVTPVGVVWRFIKQNYPNIQLYQLDGSHPSEAGSYLAACCFYTSIFQKDPQHISYNYSLDAQTATIIKNAVKSMVFDHLTDWYIGRYVPHSNFNYIIGNGLNEVKINSVTTQYANSFIWDFGDGTTSTALLPTHNYTADGIYTIKLTSNKCYLGENHESVTQHTVQFCAHTNTIYPNLILCPNTTGTVYTQSADSYQWCDEFGNPIPGATNQSFEVLAGNSYSVITTVNGCTEQSPQIFVDTLIGGIGNDDCNLNQNEFENHTSIKTFPNPANKILQLETTEKIKQISIYNSSAKELPIGLTTQNTLDVSNLPQGLYMIKLLTEQDKTITTKFIKN